MAQAYAPARSNALPAAALAGLLAVAVGAFFGIVWALLQAPPVLLAWAGAAAVFWFSLFATAADEQT